MGVKKVSSLGHCDDICKVPVQSRFPQSESYCPWQTMLLVVWGGLTSCKPSGVCPIPIAPSQPRYAVNKCMGEGSWEESLSSRNEPGYEPGLGKRGREGGCPMRGTRGQWAGSEKCCLPWPQPFHPRWVWSGVRLSWLAAHPAHPEEKSAVSVPAP